jgi:peptide deformylase
MAILEVMVYPNPALRVPTEPVTEFDERLKKFISDMFETLYIAKGVGLAAPQVGDSRRVFVAEFEGARHVIINPEIIEADGAERSDEGCLSFPGIYEEVTRPNRIRVRYLDENGGGRDEILEGFLARVYSHETDHLNGRLMIDHLSAMKRTFLRKKMERRAKSA